MKFLYISLIVVILDQLSKISIKQYWIQNNLFYQKINIFGDYLRFVFIENPGIAFGIDTSRYHLYITFLTVFAVIFLIYHLYKLIEVNSPECLSWSFILGGAIGNCIDRILVLIPNLNYKGVVDFIDVGIGDYRWYIFNIADASITVGLIIFLYQSYIISKKK